MISYPGQTTHRVVMVERIGRTKTESLERSSGLTLDGE